MEVHNPASAVRRITGSIRPRPLVTIELRRKPKFNDMMLMRLLQQAPNVHAVRKREEGGFLVEPVTSIDARSLSKLITDLVALANVIV